MRLDKIMGFALGAIALVSVAGSAQAGGGIGKVWSTGVTPNSISVSWSIPNKFSLGSYQVCYKLRGEFDGVCSGGDAFPVRHVGSDTSVVLVHGLQPNTNYKIKVTCIDCKKNGKRPSNRKVGTLTLRTAPTPPAVPPVQPTGGSAWVSGMASNSITVSWSWNSQRVNDRFAICWKKRWAPGRLSYCRDWKDTSGGVDKHGSNVEIAVNPTRSFHINNLFVDRSYTIVVYHNRGGDSGNNILLGEVRAKTSR